MTERDYAPLSTACVRGLCDKIYEKRKCAGVEIEKLKKGGMSIQAKPNKKGDCPHGKKTGKKRQCPEIFLCSILGMVKDFNDANNINQIKRLLRVLGQDLISVGNPNVKNGALMGLSSVAVGLSKECVKYLPELLEPIVACFSEADSRVRYQATESLFNVAKIAREAMLAHFPVVFDALGKLATDSEPQVKQGAELLDRLIKDIVTESATFELSAFVPLLRERIYTRNAFGRQFIISWVSVLDAVPDIDLIVYLPEILDGLFKMLDDVMPEIKRMCDVQLNEFLRSIKKDPSRVDFSAMINVLIVHAQSPEEMLQFTAITWIKEFVELSGADMLPYMSGILMAVLPCLSYNEDSRRNIKETAAIVNFQLSKLIASASEEEGSGEASGAEGRERMDLPAVVEVLSQLLHHNSVHTKVAVLKWILHLYNRIPSEMFGHTDKLFLSLVGSLTDASDDVVRQSLAVLAEVCSGPTRKSSSDLESSPYYYKFLTALLRLLAADDNLLEDRGAFIIRQLCVLLNAEDIYKALSMIMLSEKNLKFVSTMVDILNTILLTSAELYDLRLQLKHFNKPRTHMLFGKLYECWCHSPVSLLALCLLTHNYAHCNRLIKLFGDLEITVDFLTEVDKLVQLIESPIFAYLRLELLDSEESESLRSALHGLLMLLPQTEAFQTLRRRLQCAPPPTPHHLLDKKKPSDNKNNIDFDLMIKDFTRIQAAHRAYKLTDRTKNLSLFDKSHS